jgi:hypothetical protein
MPRAICLLSVVVAFCLANAPARALPPPLSEEELLHESNLVALVRILSVTCVSVSQDPQSGEALPNYSANAELIEVIKGDEAKGSDIEITFSEIPTGVLGPWTVFYYPGEMVWTHLVGKDRVYTTTWWNGRGKVVSEAATKELPTKPGETVAIQRMRSERPVEH